MLRQVGRCVVVGLACLCTVGCGGSPDSASLGAAVVTETSANTFTHGRVPDLTLVAMDGSRLIVVGTVDARCHPQSREPQVAAVGASYTKEE